MRQDKGVGKIEIEQKFIVRDFKKLMEALDKLGAKKLHTLRESNQLFDLQGTLKKQGKALRLRQNAPGKNAVLTYKGTLIKGKYKQRTEIETPVDYPAMLTILNNLGFECVFEYSKKRITYQFKKTLITIDTLNNGVRYCEIEGSEKSIDRLSLQLGFLKSDREDRTYPQILKKP